MEEIYRIADRITVLRDGRHVGTADAADLPADRLVSWMVGRELDQHFPARTAGRGRPLLEVRGFSLPDPSGVKAWAVEDASFDLREGEILGFAGLQGSGKSELFGGLFGAFGPAVRGRIAARRAPRSRPGRPAASIGRGLALLTNDRKGSGLVLGHERRPQHHPGLPPRTSRRAAGSGRPGKAAAAEGDVRDFDIRVRSLDQEAGTLSGGNQQKVVLAKWLETEPKVLLLDEPTLGVDVGAKHEIYQLMNRWTAEGMAILLITSELPELLAMSDRILVMHRGRILAELDRAEATQERVRPGGHGERGERMTNAAPARPDGRIRRALRSSALPRPGRARSSSSFSASCSTPTGRSSTGAPTGTCSARSRSSASWPAA